VAFGAGIAAGGLGTIVGVSGGVFLVPMLIVLLGLPFQQAAGISLMTVIATSGAIAAGRAGQGLINVRLGMLLEIGSASGALLGGLAAYHLFSERALSLLFAACTGAIGITTLARLNKRNALDPAAEPGRLGGRYVEARSGREIVYRTKRLPVGVVTWFLAGNLAGLLGIGGGVIKTPSLTMWCGVPLRAAAATSGFMMGVTAVASVPLYYARGAVVPQFAAAAVLGVLLGAAAGLKVSDRLRVRWLKIVLAVVLFLVSAVMIARAAA